MSHYVGQIVPYRKPRGILGEDLEQPRWHALRVTPQRERFTREFLRAEGIFAFYPEEERVRFHRGKRLVTKHPQVSQLVYAKFDRTPQWDVMRDRKIATGVVTSGLRPVDISYQVIRRIQGLPERERVMADAAVELAALRVGQTTELLDDLFEGFAVEITSIRDRRVWWAHSSGMKGETTLDRMQGAVTPITPERLEEVARDRGIDFAEACVDVSVHHCGATASRAAAQRLDELRRELAT